MVRHAGPKKWPGTLGNNKENWPSTLGQQKKKIGPRHDTKQKIGPAFRAKKNKNRPGIPGQKKKKIGPAFQAKKKIKLARHMRPKNWVGQFCFFEVGIPTANRAGEKLNCSADFVKCRVEQYCNIEKKLASKFWPGNWPGNFGREFWPQTLGREIGLPFWKNFGHARLEPANILALNFGFGSGSQINGPIE